MTSQVLSSQAPAVKAFVSLLRAHAAVTRTFSADLSEEHGLTINDYEALLLLAHADGGRLRRIDLAQSLQLTPSGVTRLLDGLEHAGYVTKAQCASDARVTYAVLTRTGRAKLAQASESHLTAIDALFSEHYTRAELESLADLLGRLPGSGGSLSCAPPS